MSQNSGDPSEYIFALWNLIIRPPRNRYNDSKLYEVLPKRKFKVGKKIIHRKEFTLLNERGLRLLGTIFEPEGVSKDKNAERACVVHCHGNSSNRLEGFSLVPVLCPMNIAVVCFDFAGSGNSDGDYVSLGYYERDDLRMIVGNLRNEFGFTRIGLWGYSMGAATAIMYASTDSSIAGIVVDSPFSDLCTLITEVCFNQLRLPSLLMSTILPILRLIIISKAQFDIYEVSPSKHVSSCYVPAFVMHGEEDDFIPPSHSEQLKREYTGEAMRVLMPEATHTSIRNKVFLKRAAVFLVRALRWEAFLPPEYTEERLAQLADTREARPQETPAGSLTAPRLAKAAADEGLCLLLASSNRAKRCLGAIYSACDCCAYRGAELLPCRSRTEGVGYGQRAPLFDAHCSASLPASFEGSVTFPNDRAEIAMCWVQGTKAPPSAADFKVYFAMLSAHAISLTRVTLISDEAKVPLALLNDDQLKERAQVIRAAKESGRSIGGLRCLKVEPLALTAAQLLPGEQHTVRLTVTQGRVVLTGGEARLEHTESEQQDQVELWCLQWKSAADTSTDARAHLELAALESQHAQQLPKEDARNQGLRSSTTCAVPPQHQTYLAEGAFINSSIGVEAAFAHVSPAQCGGFACASQTSAQDADFWNASIAVEAAFANAKGLHRSAAVAKDAGTMSSANSSTRSAGVMSLHGSRQPFDGTMPFEERLAQSLAKMCLGDTDSSETSSGSSAQAPTALAAYHAMRNRIEQAPTPQAQGQLAEVERNCIDVADSQLRRALAACEGAFH